MALNFTDKLKFKKGTSSDNNADSESVEETGNLQSELQEQVRIYLVENIDKLQKWFSDAQMAEKLVKFASKVGSKIIYPVLLLYNLYKSPNTSAKEKMMIIAPLAYFILPFDLIPDAMIGPGFADDGIALMTSLKAMVSSMTPEIFEQSKAMHKKLIGEIDASIAEKIENAGKADN